MGHNPYSTRREQCRAHPPLLIKPSAKPPIFEKPPQPFSKFDTNNEKVKFREETESSSYIQIKDDFFSEYFDRFGEGIFVICKDCIQ
jgi:hypothetical protein